MAHGSSWREFFESRYEELGGKAEPIKAKDAIRVNTLRTTHAKLLARMEEKGVKLSKIPFTRDGYYVERSRFSLGSTEEFLLGQYYVQEAAAQIPAEILNPKPGELVLDACAAPGGKTTQLAQLMNNKGTIIATEYKRHRCMSLKINVERMHVQNVIAYAMDAYHIAKKGLKYDKILLDAPCSGNYVIDKEWFEKRTIMGVKTSAQIQRGLIKACIKALKPGGELVYSVCSLEPEECELNMQWMLENFDVNIIRTNLQEGEEGLRKVFGMELDKQIRNCRRFWPNKTGTQGFFVAKVKK